MRARALERPAPPSELERRIVALEALADGIGEALHAIRRELTSPRYADEDSISIDTVLRLVTFTIERGCKREIEAVRAYDRERVTT